MLLSHHDAQLLFRLHRALMHFVNRRLSVAPDVGSLEEFARLPAQVILDVRKGLLDRPDLIESFVDENPAGLDDDQLDIVVSWRHQVAGTFYIFRQLKKHMIFLSPGESPVAYGVVALTEPFEALVGAQLPVMTETVLLPFKDKIVYDGLLNSFNIVFGGGIKRRLNDEYRQAKERLGIVTSLPVDSAPRPAANSTKPSKKSNKKSRASSGVKEVLHTVVELTDDFCRRHLNDEYAELCRQLAEKVARKRPSPLMRGQPKTWACGIIRTIGMVNFLDDPASQPYLKLTAVDEALGVSQSSGQGRSREIRKMLKIRQLDLDWTLPSRMDDNPLAWMLEVDGFIMDMRTAPRELQEMAFEEGLIPYIPADREAAATNSPGA